MFNMQQHAAATNMFMDRFQKVILNELIIRDTPHIIIKVTYRLWYLYFLTSILTRDPPRRYPMALAKKMKE